MIEYNSKKVTLAEHSGYCFGVKNAMNSLENAISQYPDKVIYTLGPLTHNSQVMEQLNKRGVICIKDLKEIENPCESCVIIRSHGVGKEIFETLNERGITVVDGTCPFVKAVQKKIENFYKKNYQIVIVGNPKHPEVIGENGWCSNEALIIDNIEEAEQLAGLNKICIVAQTTIIDKKFNDIISKVNAENDDVVIFNTICSATTERQNATENLSKEVDIMLVIGGFHSSNTQKLVDISKKHCVNTFHIETLDDIKGINIKAYNRIGITAGASTPDWIIKEVLEKMEQETNMENESVEEKEQSFEALIEDSLKKIRTGEVVEGEVLTVEEDEIILNIGYKSDGVISKSDYSRDKDINLTEEVKVGDKVEAVITDLNDGTGNVKLSRTKFEGRKIQTQLRESYENKTVLEGTIQSVSGKGLIVDVGFTTIYMPASQYHVKYIKDLDTLVGKEVKGIIIDYNQRQRRAILSQKVLIEEEYQARKAKEKENKEKRFAELNIDDVVSGTVKTIKDFGIFVDLDGIDGFIHRSDLTWTRINSPKDVVSQGDTIEAKVIEKNDEELKIKLSKKALEEEPWDVFVKTYEVGSIVPVTVTKIMPYGAFAKIIPGVEGLLHISEISYKRVEKVETELSEGQEIEVKIIGIDEDKKKISLSIKATEKAPARQRDDSVFEKPAFKKASSAPRKQRPRKNSAGNMNAGNAEQAVHTEQMENSLGDLSALSGLLDSLPEDDTAEEA